MADVLTTERLILQPLQLSDAEQIQQLFPVWEIVQFLNASVPWPYPPDGVHQFFRDVALPAIARGDEWYWTLRPTQQPERIIGALSLHRGDKLNRGFWLSPPWRGQGLMTEAVYATNDYWFDALGFEVLRVSKAVANSGSRRISEKTGMRVTECYEADYVSGHLPTERWELTATEWRAKRDELKLR